MLRPRYSLLTLLVLTALVALTAGGMKLWIGPHRVVERPEPDEEVEYTFTRQWSTAKLIDGPFIRRKYEQGQLRTSKIRYWRHNHQLPAWGCDFYNIAPRRNESRPSTKRACEGDTPLTPDEQQEFQAAIEREQNSLRAADLRSDEYQGNSLYDDPRSSDSLNYP